ncbi:MAG: type III-B CRISPR module-associated protein Cmr3 [Chloroflexota bacterium]|nr:type III-B CRISPR module-associated protein Cmr3 [Chloroflexota bacterium]
MKLFIEPVDVWLFRDGRPFNAGADHRARSLFPPYPSVMQGVIRSHHLVLQGIDLSDARAIEEAVGTATDYRDLRLRGPFVARREKGQVVRYFPAPLDGVLRDDDKLHPLTPRKVHEGVATSAPTPYLLWDEGEPKKPEGRMWLSKEALNQYLDGEAVEPTWERELFQRENRLGVGIDDATRTTAESHAGGGLLYEAEFIRVQKDVGLEVEVEGLPGLNEWPERGVLRMGGEGHGGRYEPSNSQGWPTIPDPLPPRLRVYFATPTFLNEGWRPDTWARFFEGEVELMAAAVGRYQSIGGFDVAAGRQKAARRYVPAGSVYYFECQGKARLEDSLLNDAITDAGAKIGFGQVIIRRWSDV